MVHLNTAQWPTISPMNTCFLGLSCTTACYISTPLSGRLSHQQSQDTAYTTNQRRKNLLSDWRGRPSTPAGSSRGGIRVTLLSLLHPSTHTLLPSIYQNRDKGMMSRPSNGQPSSKISMQGPTIESIMSVSGQLCICQMPVTATNIHREMRPACTCRPKISIMHRPTGRSTHKAAPHEATTDALHIHTASASTVHHSSNAVT